MMEISLETVLPSILTFLSIIYAIYETFSWKRIDKIVNNAIVRKLPGIAQLEIGWRVARFVRKLTDLLRALFADGVSDEDLKILDQLELAVTTIGGKLLG